MKGKCAAYKLRKIIYLLSEQCRKNWVCGYNSHKRKWRMYVEFNGRVFKVKSVPTKRALDAGDSVRFSSIFLASSFLCSQAESTPAHPPLTQTVSPPLAQICFNHKNVKYAAWQNRIYVLIFTPNLIRFIKRSKPWQLQRTGKSRISILMSYLKTLHSPT